MPTAINHGTNNDQNIIVQVDYDKGGRMVAMRDPNGQETTYEYDQLGRRTKLTNPLNQEWTTSYAETANGTQTTMNYPEANHSVTRDFDLLGRLTGIQYGNQLTTPDVDFTYDAAGNRSKMTETGDLGSGATTIRETTYSYDNARRLTSVGFDEDGNGVVDETVAYDYDISGRRTSLTFDGQTIGYEYDERGRLITLTDWDTGRSTFSYDGAGRHIATQRPNGMRSSYRHDRAGRLARLQHHKGLSKLAQFDYIVDGRGNRTQVIEMLRPATANYATRTFAYNHADISYKGTWANAGQFKATDDWADSLALTVTGDELTLTYGTGPDHSIFDIYVGGTFYNSYDGYAASTGEETVAIHLDSDQRISFEIKNRHEQNLASSGFRVRFKQLQAKSKLTTEVIDYTYDGLSRLVNADYGSDRSYAYQYDLAGNRTQQQTTIGITTTTTNWTYDNANRMATMQIGSNPVTNFSYDANGNLTDDGVLTYSYDRANRVSSVNNGTYNTHFAYDGNGDRYQQTVGGTISNYLLDTQPGLAVVLQETTGADTLNYIHSPMGVHAVEDSDDWHYMLDDGLGSVCGQVDEFGAVIASQMYDPYGQPFDVMGTFVGDFGYAGEQIDSNGLSYNRARTYNPSLGAFTSLDSFEGYEDEPMSLNGYSYAESNPVMYTDPTGECKANPAAYEVHELRCHWNAQYISEQMGIPLETMLNFQWWELELAMPRVSLWLAEQGLSQLANAPLPADGNIVGTASAIQARAVGQGGLGIINATPEDRARANEAFKTWLLQEGVRFFSDTLDALYFLRDLACGQARPVDVLALLPLITRSTARLADEFSDINTVVRNVDNAVPNQRVVLDVFGGQNSQIRSLPGYEDAILVDVVAQEGVIGSALRLPFGVNTIDEIVINNPYIPFPSGATDVRDAQRLQIYQEVYRVLKPDSVLIINAGRTNNYRIVPPELTGLELVSQTGLDSRFSSLVFRRTNGSVIRHDSMETLIYVRR